MYDDKRVFKICQKCSCLYREETANHGGIGTCLGGGIHEPASPDGSPNPYSVLVPIAFDTPSNPFDRWYKQTGFRVCVNCHVLNVQQKNERFQEYSDHVEYCPVSHDRHALDLKSNNFQVQRAPEESDFRLCKVCGCLYQIRLGKQHCLDMNSTFSVFHQPAKAHPGYALTLDKPATVEKVET